MYANAARDASDFTCFIAEAMVSPVVALVEEEEEEEENADVATSAEGARDEVNGWRFTSGASKNVWLERDGRPDDDDESVAGEEEASNGVLPTPPSVFLSDCIGCSRDGGGPCRSSCDVVEDVGDPGSDEFKFLTSSLLFVGHDGEDRTASLARSSRYSRISRSRRASSSDVIRGPMSPRRTGVVDAVGLGFGVGLGVTGLALRRDGDREGGIADIAAVSVSTAGEEDHWLMK